MLIIVSKEKLVSLLEEESRSWLLMSPNPEAFDFDPTETDPKLLEEKGYYANREAWIANARLGKIREYLQEEVEKAIVYMGG